MSEQEGFTTKVLSQWAISSCIRWTAGIDLVARLAKALETSISDLLPEAETPDSLPLLKEQVEKLTETLKAADRDTMPLIVPLLARLLESPTRRR